MLPRTYAPEHVGVLPQATLRFPLESVPRSLSQLNHSSGYQQQTPNLRLCASISLSEILLLLQRDRHVAVFPNEIVEIAEIEFVALLHARVGEKFQDL